MTKPAQNLARRATTVALRNGWEVLHTLSEDEAEIRLLVDSGGASGRAELCVRGAGTDREERTLAEIAALRSTRSEHVLRLIEVVPVASGRQEERGSAPPGLLVEHATGGDLSRLLGRRSSIRAGEAATILLSIAQGLEALHEAGWAHGELTTRSVVFRRDGCPAIGSLISARPLTSSALEEDRRSFLQLSERVTASVARDEGDGMLGAVREALAVSDWDGVARAVTGATEPEAVLLPVDVPDPAPPPRQVSGGGIRLAEIVDGQPIAALIGAGQEWLRGRKKLLVAVAVPLAAVALVLALMPSGGEKPTRSGSAERADAVAVTGAPGESPRSVPPRASSSPQAAATDSAHSSPPPATDAPNVPGDAHDPLGAAQRLLDARHACYSASGSGEHCLESSVERGSGLFRTDVAALGQAGAADARDLRGAALELSQQWGDAALITISGKSEPASLLLVRGKAGWRIREMYP